MQAAMGIVEAIPTAATARPEFLIKVLLLVIFFDLVCFSRLFKIHRLVFSVNGSFKMGNQFILFVGYINQISGQFAVQ
jgi:hypothetical protein